MPSARPVLIADDDAALRSYLRGCLEGLGFAVVEAADGEAALRLARAERPALVIADVRMSRVDGLALRDALAADTALAGVPVLLMTGDAGIARATRCLPKPFNAALLREHLDLLLPGAAP